MRLRYLLTALTGAMLMTATAHADPFDQWRWKNRVLVITAPAGDPAAAAQRRIYETAAKGMAERAIVLTEARDDSARSQAIRASLSADRGRFHVYLVGKDGNTAVASDKPLSADELFGRVDAMPMRKDEMRRKR